jgi:hypothetical protein
MGGGGWLGTFVPSITGRGYDCAAVEARMDGNYGLIRVWQIKRKCPKVDE